MEMEQRIRDAWQIFANEFTYTGGSYAGVQFIQGNVGCPYDCTEGDGYALLAAAYMADKTIFDGLWFQIHDAKFQMEPTYAGCVVANPTYPYGRLPKDNTSDSAGDGDVDIAMALVLAWYQWGDNSGYTDACLNPISYKKEALNMMKALVDTAAGTSGVTCTVATGDVGIDGYMKSGDTFGEMTNWAAGQCPQPQFGGPTTEYMDYNAPSYFHDFSAILQSSVFGVAPGAWEPTQFQRAETAGDWLMGQENLANDVPFAGNVQVAGTTATFSNFSQGEDFRNAWRTVLNYVWHGAPTQSWNPAAHAVAAGTNTYEVSEATRFDNLIKLPQSLGQACSSFGSSPIKYQGTQTMVYDYNLGGTPNGAFNLNWPFGTGSVSAVAAQDFPTMAKLFRELTIEWDVTTAGDNYLSSVPVYFHGFFRWLGMAALSGNLQDPLGMAEPDTAAVIPANMKLYKSVNRTFAFPGDTLTYWLNYRNYASVAASGVTITDTLPAGLSFLSSTPASTQVGGTVSFAVGAVPGLQNAAYAATMGGVTLVATVNPGTVGDIICNTASVACGNGTGWTSNGYPDDPDGVFDGGAVTNYTNAVMQRNCVDIVPTALSLTKSASTTLANPGNTITYTLAYQNNQVPFLNGGRPGVVVSFANGGVPASASQLLLGIKIWHDADLAYINYQNYRLSYYMNQASYPAGSWNLQNTVYMGGIPGGVTVTQENLTPGANWNQRLIIQCANEMATITPHLFEYSGMGARIHQGGTAQLLALWNVYATGYPSVNWSNDWSADTLANDAGNQGDPWYPVSPDWTTDGSGGIPVTQVYPDECAPVNPSPHQVTNVLIEEWDGYTWRRAFGNGPVSGRPMTNVTLTDTLPAGETFGGFIGTPGVQSGGTLTWTFPKLEVNQSGTVSFWATTNAVTCPVNQLLTNQAVIQATNEDPVSSAVGVSLTCNALPTPVPAFLKSAQPASANVGGNVTYNLSYTAPSPITTVADSFATNVSGVGSWGNWSLAGGAANSWTISGGVLSDGNWASTAMQDSQTNAVNTTVTVSLQIPASQWAGVILRSSGGSYYEAIASPNGAIGTVEFEKVVAGTATVLATTGANQPIPTTTFQLRVIAQGNTFIVEYDTGAGWVNPLGTITDSSIAGPGLAGIMVQPSGVDFENFSATLDRMTMSIYDTTPANTTYVSSVNSTSQPAIGAAGPVVWGLGTVVSGTLESVTLVVQVATCPAGGFVTNQAFLAGPQLASNALTTTVACGTPTFTPSLTASPSLSPSPSATGSPTVTATPSPSVSRTSSPSVTDTATQTQPATPISTPSSSPSQSATPTVSPSPSLSPSSTASPTLSPPFTPTSSPTVTSTATVSPVYTPTSSPTDTSSPTPSPTASDTPTLTATESATPTCSASATLTASPSASASATATPTLSPSATLTASASQTASSTASPSSTASGTATTTATLTASATVSPSFTATRTATVTATRTASFTPSPSFSVTATVSLTTTRTPSFTITPTFSASPTWYQPFYQQPVLIQQKAVYPNPFTNAANLYFMLRVDANVRVEVFNVAGEIIFRKDYGCLAGPNDIQWLGVNDYGARTATGIYIVTVKASGVDGSQGGYWVNLACTR